MCGGVGCGTCQMVMPPTLAHAALNQSLTTTASTLEILKFQKEDSFSVSLVGITAFPDPIQDSTLNGKQFACGPFRFGSHSRMFTWTQTPQDNSQLLLLFRFLGYEGFVPVNSKTSMSLVMSIKTPW